jgi:carbon monoxide dehydrogenase subunit G
MAPVVKSVDISRRPEEVFAFATDFSRFPEWQGGVVSARPQGNGSLAIGSKATVTRRVGRREMARTEEITELSPPRSWAVRGGGGSLIATARGSIEPLDQGRRARLTIALDFEARGIARLFLPFVLRRQARKQLPINERRLRELLEQAA